MMMARVTSTQAVSTGLVMSIEMNTATIMTRDMIMLGMDWLIIWRRVSGSLE